jgi:hypothetical protein
MRCCHRKWGCSIKIKRHETTQPKDCAQETYHATVDAATSSWDDLTTTAVNSVSMKDDIVNVEAASTHVLVAQDSLLGSPLESSNAGILDLSKVLENQEQGEISIPRMQQFAQKSLTWTPLVTSVSKLGPVPSGPKHQTLRASVTSKLYFSAMSLVRSLGSCLAEISPLSQSSAKPSGMG